MSLEGHSGAKLWMHHGRVRKRSPYLLRCSDSEFEVRRRFLLRLSAEYLHMPALDFPFGRIVELEHVEGRQGLDGIDLPKLGAALRVLHRLRIGSVPEKDTGIEWLIDLAGRNLRTVGQAVPAGRLEELRVLPRDAIVHGEPSNVITDARGDVYFVDWEECGLGSPYQDLGHIGRGLDPRRGAELHLFLEGYADHTVDATLVKWAAGLESLAAARWADFDARIELGLRLLAS